MELSSHIILAPRRLVADRIRLPGSKSISNRALLLAALAQGETTLDGVLFADDTAVMLQALQTLGISCTLISTAAYGNCYRIRGCGGVFPQQKAELFLGNAGTALRPLTAVLALQPAADYRVYGVPRMHERPIGDLVEALNAIGANISYESKTGYPPLLIRPAHIHTSTIRVKADVSSQFLTAVLIASPLVARTDAVKIVVEGALISAPYVHITEQLMQQFGISIQSSTHAGGRTFSIAAGQSYVAQKHYSVEGDASSASYFLAAAAISGQAITVEGVGSDSVQGDIHFADILQKMGIPIRWQAQSISVAAHKVVIPSGTWNGIEIPDAAMTLATMALFASGDTTLTGIASWRVKETDRISAMANELQKLGAQVKATADSLWIKPPAELQPATIDTYDDHRMAMCFSLASLHGIARAATTVTIVDPSCVGKTFPTYFDEFLRLTASSI